MKVCYICKLTLRAADYYPSSKAKDGLQHACKKCMREYANGRRRLEMLDPIKAEARRAKERAAVEARRIKDPARMRAITTDSLLRKTYGLSLKEFSALSAAQGDVCAICGSKCGNYSRLSVDHDHETGAIRGLLCNTCNRGVGLMKDNPAVLRAAAEYLEKAAERAAPQLKVLRGGKP